MAPLPCSPVSNSTASEQSHTASEEDTDDSLTTPRPGPTDPAQRTVANLSKPSVPTYSSSPESPKKANASNKDSLWDPDKQSDGQRRSPYTYGTSPTKPSDGGAEAPRPPQLERTKSVSWSPQAAEPKRQGSYSMARRHSPNVSPHADLRNRLSEEVGGDSSADESTAIFPRDRITGTNRSAGNYGAMAGEHDDEPNMGATGLGYEGEHEDPEVEGSRRRKSTGKAKGGRNASIPARGQEQAQGGAEEEEGSEHEGWIRRVFEKYGSVELENKGSVARDHLALERTFLAWLRTSLSFASIGIAVTQLFRLNTSLQNSGNQRTSSLPADSADLTVSQRPIQDLDTQASLTETHHLRQVGKPLGATFLGISILILMIGFHRYFESQHYVIRGKFPASRGSIILVSLVACGLIITSLVVVVVIAPSAFERR